MMSVSSPCMYLHDRWRLLYTLLKYPSIIPLRRRHVKEEEIPGKKKIGASLLKCITGSLCRSRRKPNESTQEVLDDGIDMASLEISSEDSIK